MDNTFSIRAVFSNAMQKLAAHCKFFFGVIILQQSILLGLIITSGMIHPLLTIFAAKHFPAHARMYRVLMSYLPSVELSVGDLGGKLWLIILLSVSFYFLIVLYKMTYDTFVDGRPSLSSFKNISTYIFPLMVGGFLSLFIAFVLIQMQNFFLIPFNLIIMLLVYIFYRFFVFYIPNVFEGHSVRNALIKSWQSTRKIGFRGLIAFGGILLIDILSSLKFFFTEKTILLSTPVALFSILYSSVIMLVSITLLVSFWNEARSVEG